MNTLELRNQTEMVKLCLSLSERVGVLENEIEELKNIILKTPLLSNDCVLKINDKENRKLKIYNG